MVTKHRVYSICLSFLTGGEKWLFDLCWRGLELDLFLELSDVLPTGQSQVERNCYMITNIANHSSIHSLCTTNELFSFQLHNMNYIANVYIIFV